MSSESDSDSSGDIRPSVDSDSTSDTPEEIEMFLLAPPPEHQRFPTEKATQTFLRKWASENGFSVSREKTPRNEVGQVRAVFYQCSLAGWPKNTRKLLESERVHPMRGSMKCNCPMRIKICAVDADRPDHDWQIVYTEDGSQLHNHPPAADVSVFPSLRRQEKAEIRPIVVSIDELMRLQFAAGATPREVHALVQQVQPGTLLTEKDVANTRDADRSTALAEKNPTEAMFDLLRQHGFWYRFEINVNTRELVRLFWAHPASVELYRDHPDVLVMDCTYKTNAHDMPLLNVVSMTAFNTILPVAQCWMPGETEDDFVWSLQILGELMRSNTISPPHVMLSDRDLACLNAMDRVFPGIPSLICRWHMNRNVLAKARFELGQISNPLPEGPRFVNSPETDAIMALYYAALNAKMTDAFEQAHRDIHDSHSGLAAYLDTHWWKHKRRVVRCWTDTFHHFGYRDTSPVEGTTKQWLQSSRGDLFTALRKLLPWWTKTTQKLRYRTEKDAAIIPHLLRVQNLYERVVRVISLWALVETDKLWKDATRIVQSRLPRSECEGAFRAVHGRPCLHEIMRMIDTDDVLTPEHFNRHWWIPRAESYMSTRVFAPVNVRKRRRATINKRSHQAGAGIHGTRRDPTMAERVDQNNPARLLPNQSPAVVVLPPLSTVLDATRIDTPPFIRTELPPRNFGRAGRHAFDDQQDC